MYVDGHKVHNLFDILLLFCTHARTNTNININLISYVLYPTLATHFSNYNRFSRHFRTFQ